MADYGLRIIGEHGATQIDSEYRNHQLVASGSIAHEDMTFVSGSGGASVMYEMNMPGLTSPLIAFACADAPVFYYESSSGNYLFIKTDPDTANPAPINYWVFDLVATAAEPAGYGLVIWNATGQIAFDSGRKSLSIVDFLLGVDPGGTSGSGSLDTTYPSGRTYAVAPCRLGFDYVHQALGVGTNFDVLHAKFTTGMMQAGNVCRLRWVPEYIQILPNNQSPPFSEAYRSAETDWLIVDVTNY
ncbi:hypothetical protein V5F89_12510 [Pelagerythrobacter marensis]|uniref:Uncharacterized protein n=1 Tax=Pelagerythrobacter marensis TaxID=543877 RepID=A0ABZ2D5L2_9SPHN